MSFGLSSFSRRFPAAAFNRAVDLFLRGYPFAGAGILIAPCAGGWLLTKRPGGEWEHPWMTSPQWSAERLRWEATVRAGFVNGMDPLVPGVGEKGADADLVDNPRIPLRNFRALGNDEGAPAPVFFQRLGVRKNSDALQISAGGVSLDATRRSDVGQPPQRWLRAIDLYVSIARLALAGSVQIVDPTGASGQQVVYRVGYDGAAVDRYGTRARLYTAAEYEPPRKPTLAERLLGTFNDPTEDTRLISTVYLLSPAGVPAGNPDGTWTPYVAHATFWNLAHAARNARPVEPPEPIRLFTGLLGGIGDAIGNAILAQINEFSDRVSNAVNNVSNEGKFWTV